MGVLQVCTYDTDTRAFRLGLAYEYIVRVEVKDVLYAVYVRVAVCVALPSPALIYGCSVIYTSLAEMGYRV